MMLALLPILALVAMARINAKTSAATGQLLPRPRPVAEP